MKDATPGSIDLVIIREQTEGLFASQTGGIVLHDDVATDTLRFGVPGPNEDPSAWDWVRVTVTPDTARRPCAAVGSYDAERSSPRACRGRSSGQPS